ncbi:hypothetical protein M433DRAFT_366288 [Acidomyces richmondensis BFW]|nr:MAG: hypothetical protein FE78DRAFT_195857 [Acidomyces sp. 'richmondensis']KYG48983.1 hypothetical protein M433DRAFT_366288 [Acidomyces richmondensis BFW]
MSVMTRPEPIRPAILIVCLVYVCSIRDQLTYIESNRGVRSSSETVERRLFEQHAAARIAEKKQRTGIPTRP